MSLVNFYFVLCNLVPLDVGLCYLYLSYALVYLFHDIYIKTCGHNFDD